MPFLLHIGGGGRSLKAAFHDNGRPTTDFLGGGENVRSKDYMAISPGARAVPLGHGPRRRPRRPSPACGAAASSRAPCGSCRGCGGSTSSRTRSRRPSRPCATSRCEASDYVHRQLAFTPFPREDVGWLIEQCGDDLFLFSSDYPHPEGTKDPVERFEDTMAGVDDAARDRFYRDNYADMLGWS